MHPDQTIMQKESEESPGPRSLNPVAPELAEVRWYFGPFALWETQRRLERAGSPMRLGPRPFDLLLQLVKRAGEFVNKDELLATVWAGVVVEEGSVRVHMSALRKVLGEPEERDGCKEWISNVPLRGYRFNGRVRHEAIEGAGRARARPVDAAFTRLPVRLTELVGREAEVGGVLAALDTHRFVTLVGPGGIGKTSVAVSASERLQTKQAAQVAFVDLSPLISQDHVLGTIARALGAAADMPDTVLTISQYLAGLEVLLLIDNCEHVIESLAVPIVGLLKALPGLRILATSREALRVTGEYVIRLSALAVPAAEHVSFAEAMHWPAVELLVERAAAAGAGGFGDAHGPLLARIARQLDGIPLAIELVAARLGVQSLGDLVGRLDDHMRLHSNGYRTALPRHRTLAAALDWSIALLGDDELRLFRRLSVFRGRFDVESALSVKTDIDPDAAFDALISLANKSLIAFDGTDPVAPYRLLDTTRSHAGTLLARSGERPALLRRHATQMLELMNAATAALPSLDERAWGDRYAFRLDDVRFALENCLVEQPDAKTAASLVIASTPLWFHVSQVVEYCDRVAAALALVDRQAEPDKEAAAWLSTALTTALLSTRGSNEALDAVCDRALAGALQLGIPVLELRARWGRCTHDMFRGEYSAALPHSELLLALVQSWSDPAALILGRRVSAMAHHFCGNFDVSRRHSDASVAIASRAGRTHANMMGPDAIIATQALQCRTLWIQGETENALKTAHDAVARAEAIENSFSLCVAMYGACPIALWSGEIELARKWVPLMLEETQRRGLLGWLRYAEWFAQGLDLIAARDRGLHVREVLDGLPGYDAPRKEMLVTFCADWLDDGMIERVQRGEGQWSAAEVWRAAGWRSEERGELAQAEDFYQRAVDTSRRQGATGWELRAAQSLARLWDLRGERERALRLLEALCERCPPGCGGAAFAEVCELATELRVDRGA
jgi:predicted ATPase/DNA-binding winged helix-turn-helix (wHTH) protein